MRHHKVKDRSNRIGTLLLVFGSIFLLINLDLLPYSFHNLAMNWKGIIFVVGIILFATNANKVGGTIMISIGVYLMVSQYLWQAFDINISLSRIFWPGLLMITGYILLKKRKIERMRRHSGQSFDYLSDSNIMGGGEVKVHSQSFKGGTTTAVFGGASYDMTGSKLSEGQHTLEVFAIFGGFTFIVPSDWEISLEVTAIFGALSDKRKHLKPSSEPGQKKQLLIKGFVLFGGGEIKNY